MRIPKRPLLMCLLAAGLSISVTHSVHAANRYQAIALYGVPKYNLQSHALAHTSKDAKPGGRIVLPAFGTFDTLNPYSLKGVNLSIASDQRMWGIDALNETLMTGGNEYLYSPDEAQTAYCLICEYIEYEEDYGQVSFGIHPNARFHDGSPITARDVKASFELLTGDQAHPRFSDIYRDVEKVALEDDRRITFYLKPGAGKQMLFRLGELPVMSASFWDKHRFGEALTTPPLLSGPYRVCDFKFGHRIELCRVEDFWSRSHFYYQRQFNFDKVSYEFFRDRTVAFEAFKSGKLTAWVEYIAKNWATAYDFPALKSGRVIKQQIPHGIPASYQFFALNLRRSPFGDLAFRKAITLAFDFEWTNKFLFNDAYKRSNTYFPNSAAGAEGLPTDAEKALLLQSGIPETHPMLNEPFALPRTDGSGNPRPQLKEAIALLKSAGYVLEKDQLLTPNKTPVHIEFLIDHASMSRVIQPYIRNLKKMGIRASIRSVDDSQYKSRLDKFDFDIAVTSLAQSQIPSFDLRLFFHSTQADVKSSYNYGGIRNAQVDALLDKLPDADSLEEVFTITSAIDRVLLWNYYTIPQWYLGNHRIAYQASLHRPESTPPYSLGFAAWWSTQ